MVIVVQVAPQLVESVFDDIDEMAASPHAWDLKYEQIGTGRFHGRLTQLVLGGLQLGRETRSTGILQRGTAPAGTWAFGLPLVAEGSLHIRRRPAPPGQLLAATSHDDIGLTATGPTDLMVVVLPTPMINHWMHVRRGLDRVDVDLPSPRWQVSPAEMTRRAESLSGLLQILATRPKDQWSDRSLPLVEAQIADVILGLIPSAEIIEPLHSRARIARAVLTLLLERLDHPPNITDLCGWWVPGSARCTSAVSRPSDDLP